MSIFKSILSLFSRKPKALVRTKQAATATPKSTLKPVARPRNSLRSGSIIDKRLNSNHHRDQDIELLNEFGEVETDPFFSAVANAAFSSDGGVVYGSVDDAGDLTITDTCREPVRGASQECERKPDPVRETYSTPEPIREAPSVSSSSSSSYGSSSDDSSSSSSSSSGSSCSSSD